MDKVKLMWLLIRDELILKFVLEIIVFFLLDLTYCRHKIN